jgi:hypothetical protein
VIAARPAEARRASVTRPADRVARLATGDATPMRERTTPMTMKTLRTALLCGGLCVAAAAAFAQAAEPSYKADPDVYKVIFEDANFRVIAVDRKKGVHDKLHSHSLPSIVYNVTDCKTKLYAADGKSVERDAKAGTADAAPVTPGHSAENIGTADCKQLLVEKK